MSHFSKHHGKWRKESHGHHKNYYGVMENEEYMRGHHPKNYPPEAYQ
jgi:hypothetical protein